MKRLLVLLICIGLSLPCLAQDVTRLPNGVNTETDQVGGLYNLPILNPVKLNVVFDDFNIMHATDVRLWSPKSSLEGADATYRITVVTPSIFGIKQAGLENSKMAYIISPTEVIDLSNKSKKFWFSARWRASANISATTYQPDTDGLKEHEIVVGLTSLLDANPIASLDAGYCFMTASASAPLVFKQDDDYGSASGGKTEITDSVATSVPLETWTKTEFYYDGRNRADSIKIFLNDVHVRSASYLTVSASNDLALVAGVRSQNATEYLKFEIDHILVAAEK